MGIPSEEGKIMSSDTQMIIIRIQYGHLNLNKLYHGMEKIKNGIARIFKFTNLLSYSNTSTCVGVSWKKLAKGSLVLIEKRKRCWRS